MQCPRRPDKIARILPSLQTWFHMENGRILCIIPICRPVQGRFCFSQRKSFVISIQTKSSCMGKISPMIMQVPVNATRSESRGGVALDKASQPPAAKGRSCHCVQVGNLKLLVIRGVKNKRVTHLRPCKIEQNPNQPHSCSSSSAEAYLSCHENVGNDIESHRQYR